MNETVISVAEYLNKIRPYLMWKIQSILAMYFLPFKNIDEEFVMHSKSDKIEILINNSSGERSNIAHFPTQA